MFIKSKSDEICINRIILPFISMLVEFQQHIEQNFQFIKGKKLLIAISGGVDSVVLTHLLVKLNTNEVALAHCNFQLRGEESCSDEEFVKSLGNQLCLKTFTVKFNTKQYSQKNKLSTQLSARELRYDWFNELIKKYKFDYILTAHHADDNLETFIINLTRGTGLEGLTGIPKINENIIRPLLIFSREDIKNYALQNDIEWREDTSNSETKYLRNKIRLEIVPKLKELNPYLLGSFKKTTVHLQQANQILEDQIKQLSNEAVTRDDKIVKINIKKILELSNPKAYLYQLLKSYGFKEWNNVYDLLFAQSGKFIVTKTHKLIKDRDFLLISHGGLSSKNVDLFTIDEADEIILPVHLKGKLTGFQRIDCKKSIEIDKNLVNFPLVLRKWREGDLFFPVGMNGRKKMSKFFKDEKLSVIDKESTWLLCSNEDEIIWVVGMRQDRRFIVNNQTKNIIKISTKIPNYE